MSVGDWAGLIAALAFVALVAALAIPLLKLGKVLDEARATVKQISDSTGPLLASVTEAVSTTNAQLAKVDTVTTSAAQISTNVSALTGLFAATLGTPVLKVAAFSYGVRSALRRGRARS